MYIKLKLKLLQICQKNRLQNAAAVAVQLYLTHVSLVKYDMACPLY